MAVGREFISKEIIKISVESTFCHYTRVLALESTRSRITRVGKWCFANLLSLGIKSVEVIPRKKYLTTDFE
jgi:hypothetical protein